MRTSQHLSDIQSEVWVLEDLSPDIIKTGEFRRLWEEDRDFGVGVIYSYPHLGVNHLPLLERAKLVFIHHRDPGIFPDTIQKWKTRNAHRFKHDYQFLVIEQSSPVDKVYWYQVPKAR